MSLFSSFNPVTSGDFSLNWTMLIIPLLLSLTAYWNMSSKTSLINKLLFSKVNKQFKPSMNKSKKIEMKMISLIFMVILSYNIMSLLPNTFSVTTHLSINLAIALTLWMATTMKKSTNLMNLMSCLTPSNTPMTLTPFMVFIELVSLFIQPITLSIRLTANVTAGHIMMILISQLYYLSFPSALLMNMIMMGLELGVSLIQAYVFTMLITMYMK